MIRYSLKEGVVLDARRAVFLEEFSMLAVADLHLGYAWAQRAAGQLLPLGAREDTVERLSALVAEYAPRELVLLGDLVHRALSTPALTAELRSLWDSLAHRTRFRLIAGNHDRHLAGLLAKLELFGELEPSVTAGPHFLAHGDSAFDEEAGAILDNAAAQSGLVVIGHEHPAISISDRISNRAKCPCFYVNDRLLVLPAFSSWAAGTSLGRGEFLSPFLQLAPPREAVAILAGKLLPMRL